MLYDCWKMCVMQACAQMRAGDESNASANANVQQLNQMQVQMQMRSS